MRIQVTAEMNRYGHIVVYPTAKFAKVWRGNTHDNDEALTQGAYIQDGYGVQYFLDAISPRARREIQGGYAVRPKLYDEYICALFACAH